MRRKTVWGLGVATLACAAVAGCNLALGLPEFNGTGGATSSSGSSSGSSSSGQMGGTGGTGGTGGADTHGKAIWSAGFGSGVGNTMTVAGLAVDKDGNIYLTGSFEGMVSLGGACAAPLNAPSPQRWGYVLKLGKGGDCIWAVSFGASSTDAGMSASAGTAIAVDVGGGLTVAGRYTGLPFNVPSGGVLPMPDGQDAFVVRYPPNFNPQGTPEWVTRIDGPGDQEVTSLTTDGNGGPIVVGWYTEKLSINSNQTLVGLSTKTGFALTLSVGAGDAVASKDIGGMGDVTVQDVASDVGSGIAITGTAANGVNFGIGQVQGADAGTGDLFYARYNSNLQSPTGALLGDTGLQQGSHVAFTDGLYYVSGTFTGPLQFGSSATLNNGGATAAFIAQLDLMSKGTHAISFGTLDPSAAGPAIAVDRSGVLHDVVFAGTFQGSMVAVGSMSANLHGNSDVVVGRLGTTLDSALWLRAYGDGGEQGADAVAIDPDGNVIVAGHFKSSLDLGDGKPLQSSGGAAIFVAKLNP